MKKLQDSCTPREWQIVLLIAEGHSNESMAHQLDISEQTIKRYLYNLCLKRRVNSKLEICIQYYKELLEEKTTTPVEECIQFYRDRLHELQVPRIPPYQAAVRRQRQRAA